MFLRGFMRRIAILLAVVAGWVVAWLMDLLNIALLHDDKGDEIDRISWQTTKPGGDVVTLGEADWIGLARLHRAAASRSPRCCCSCPS